MGRHSALTDLRHTIELALRGAVTVSAGAARLPERRVPPMAPLRLVGDGPLLAARAIEGRAKAAPAGTAVFTGVAHRDDLAA